VYRLTNLVVGEVVVEDHRASGRQVRQPCLTIGDHCLVRMPSIDVQQIDRIRPVRCHAERGGNACVDHLFDARCPAVLLEQLETR
jgi:hypothetical protein